MDHTSILSNADLSPCVQGNFSSDSSQILGISFSNSTKSDITHRLEARLRSCIPTRVAFLNAHCVNTYMRDKDYAQALRSADVILPDGSGVALGLRLSGQRLVANLNGTDFIPHLCRQLVNTRSSVFLLGGEPGVAESAADGLKKVAPGIRIAGSHHGFFTDAEEPGVIQAINDSGAEVLLVAMGVPKQEIWLQRVESQLRPPLRFGVGALFDFLSQRVPRAPAFFRRLGLEWTYRLFQEPKRLFRRYILGNPLFIGRVLAATLNPGGVSRKYLEAVTKRGLDVLVAFVGLLALLPLLLLVAISIRISSNGKALYRQIRIGEGGRAFTLYKFRSMYSDADEWKQELDNQNHHGESSFTFKMKRDPRVTPIGRFLRRSSIDELPQLINVLNGSMSLVGPRPALPREAGRYDRRDRERLAGKPGITCLWQISGRGDLPFERQLELDIDYLHRRSLLLDIQILVRTVRAVLVGTGAY